MRGRMGTLGTDRRPVGNSPRRAGDAHPPHHSTKQKGVRYLSLTEGYILKLGLDKNDEIIGYRFVHLGKMMEMVAKGTDANWHKNSQGVWILNNSRPPYDCCFINDSYHIIDNHGYNFVNLDRGIKYRAHGEDYGWQDWKYNGETAGTTGQKKRLEAIQIDFPDVEAKAHIQEDGWVNYGKITKDTVIGTTHEKKRLECLCLKGAFKYRVHIEGSGWTCWTNADGVCTLGSVGQKLRIEAIEIKELG